MENAALPLNNSLRDSFIKRFFSLWTVLYVFAFIGTSQFGPPIPFLEQTVVWFGKTFLGLADLQKITNTGSGDTAYDYVLILLMLILSFLLSIIILLVTRKQNNYRQLYLFAIVVVRYYVALTMLTYGLAKIFNGQFSANGYSRLEEKVGDMSPMGLVWAFMGASRPYTFISGLLEFLGGALLLFRQTKTFGALFSMTVMVNVTLLNFLYDVPVKIFSAHIVLLCVFILSYDWKTLYNFFVRHRTEKLDYNKLRVKKRWMQVSLQVIKLLLITGILYMNISGLWSTLTETVVPMEGAYTVKNFVVNNDTLSAGMRNKDSIVWNKMYIEYKDWVSIRYNSETTLWKNIEVDTVKKTFTLKNTDSSQYALLHYKLQTDTLLLSGIIMKDSASILFIRKQKKDYSLSNRGFRWVNSYPPNW